MDIQQRAALCEARVTLNGRPARISGYKNEFATVTQAGTRLSAEWAWVTVARIVAAGGAFES